MFLSIHVQHVGMHVCSVPYCPWRAQVMLLSLLISKGSFIDAHIVVR